MVTFSVSFKTILKYSQKLGHQECKIFTYILTVLFIGADDVLIGRNNIIGYYRFFFCVQ